MKLCVNASLAFTKLEKRKTKTRKRGENDENGKKDGENGRWKSVVVVKHRETWPGSRGVVSEQRERKGASVHSDVKANFKGIFPALFRIIYREPILTEEK